MIQNYFARMKEQWPFDFDLLVGIVVAITTEKRAAGQQRDRQVKHRYGKNR